jgi:hypothetical protein
MVRMRAPSSPPPLKIFSDGETVSGTEDGKSMAAFLGVASSIRLFPQKQEKAREIMGREANSVTHA